MEDCGVEDSSDELDCKTLYWGDEKGAYAKEKPPKPTDIGEGSKVKGLAPSHWCLDSCKIDLLL